MFFFVRQIHWYINIVKTYFVYSKSYLLTCLLTPRSTVLEKLTGPQLVKKFPAFYGTGKFNATFTSVCHPFLSWARSIQSILPHPTSWISILILSSYLRLSLPSYLFPSGFSTTPLYTSLLSPIHATWPAHLILLGFITRTIYGEQHRSLSSSLYSFLHSPVTSSLLGPNIPLCTLFSKTLSLLFPSMWATKFHTHKNNRQNYGSVYLNLHIFG
jgi:hypothetical protein